MKFRSAFAVLSMTVALAACGQLPFQKTAETASAPAAAGHSGPPAVSPLQQPIETGTTLTPTLRTVDLFMQCQAQRGILEFSFAEHEDGMYMFHAHQSEFTELGWVGMFDVRGPEA